MVERWFAAVTADEILAGVARFGARTFLGMQYNFEPQFGTPSQSGILPSLSVVEKVCSAIFYPVACRVLIGLAMQHLEFPLGLCAFENYTRFRLIQSSKYQELLFLESQDDPDLSFPVVPVPLLDAGYQLLLSGEDCGALGIEDTGIAQAQLVCLAIVTVSEDAPPTANLLAPVVINPATGRAVQSVRSDALYSHKHPLAPGATCS